MFQKVVLMSIPRGLGASASTALQSLDPRRLRTDIGDGLKVDILVSMLLLLLPQVLNGGDKSADSMSEQSTRKLRLCRKTTFHCRVNLSVHEIDFGCP
jgi:hypothetical protein